MSVLATPRPVRTDTRGRLSLGEPGAEYLLWEQADGAIVLKPAITISTTDAALLADDRLQERIARAHRAAGLVRRSGGRRDTGTV